jgi:hypothetical protein
VGGVFNGVLTPYPLNLVTFSPPRRNTVPATSVGSRPIVAVIAAVALGPWACAAVTPATKATSVEQIQCDGATSTDIDVRVIEGATVLAIEPVYTYVHTATTGTEMQVAGVKLVIRPPEAIDAERLLRILQCHSARAVLGQLDPSKFPDDPYWLAGAWLAIDLVPEAGNLAVTVEADGIHKNLQVLARARAFAAAHPRVRPAAPAPAAHQS